MKNKNQGLIILILCLLVLGLGGCFTYDKFLKKNTNTLKNNTETISTTYNYNLAKRKDVQAVRNDSIEVLVDKEGNVYLHTIPNSENKKTDINKTLEKQFKTYSPKGYESIDGVEFKGIRLNLNNIVTVYSVHLGNGGFTYFIFVTENGELAYLNYDKIISNGEVNVKEILNIKDVVSIVDNTYTMTPYAIDASGNEISLNDYIKE